MPADSLPTLDWNATVILAGTFFGTAVAVFLGYRSKKASPDTVSSAKDVLLPSATIADMRWGPELVVEVKGINTRLDALQLCIKEWCEEDERRRHQKAVDEAYEKGRREREAHGGRRHD